MAAGEASVSQSSDVVFFPPRRNGASQEQMCDFEMVGMWDSRVPQDHHDLHSLLGWKDMHFLSLIKSEPNGLLQKGCWNFKVLEVVSSYVERTTIDLRMVLLTFPLVRSFKCHSKVAQPIVIIFLRQHMWSTQCIFRDFASYE